MVAAATTHGSLGRSFSPTSGQNAAGDQAPHLLRVIALQQGQETEADAHHGGDLEHVNTAAHNRRHNRQKELSIASVNQGDM